MLQRLLKVINLPKLVLWFFTVNGSLGQECYTELALDTFMLSVITKSKMGAKGAAAGIALLCTHDI